MDNFMFGDGDLDNIELAGEAYGGPQGLAPVSDIGSFTQPSRNQTTNEQAQTAHAPQKLVMSNAPQPSYYSQDATEQYQSGQYRPTYPGQEMFTQRQPMQANQNVPVWSGSSDHLQQPPTNYQPSYPIQNSQAYPDPGAVNSNIPPRMQPNYQHIPSQSINQGYPQGFQGGPRPYSPYEQQRPMASGSPNINSYNAQGQPQYGIIQNPRAPYHISNYAQGQQPQPPVGPQSPMAVQLSDVSQFSNSQMPNGSSVPFRATYPQMQPAAPRPQLSPMPRSMSPHPRPNSNLSITSPVSSPAALPQTASPNPTNISGPPTPHQLETMVNPGTADRNTPTNTTIQQPLHSPVMYSNVHSPLGQRPPMSPGVGPRASIPSSITGPRPMSPQQWQQGQGIPHGGYPQPNFGQSGVGVGIQRPILQNMPPVQGSNNLADSIVNVSDSPKPNENDVSISNGPVISVAENSNSEFASADEKGTDVLSESKSVNSTDYISENSDLVNATQNVPPTSSHGAPSNSASVSEGPISVSQSSNSHAQLVTGKESSTSENGLPHTMHYSAPPSAANVPGAATMSSNAYRNTMVHYSTPQGSLPYSPQGYRYSVPQSYGQQRPQLMTQLRPMSQQVPVPMVSANSNTQAFAGRVQYVGLSKQDEIRNSSGVPIAVQPNRDKLSEVSNTIDIAPNIQDQTNFSNVPDAQDDETKINMGTNQQTIPPPLVNTSDTVQGKNLSTNSGQMLIPTPGGVVQVSVMPSAQMGQNVNTGSPQMQMMGPRPTHPHMPMHPGSMVGGPQQGQMIIRSVGPPGAPMMVPRGPVIPGSARPMLPNQSSPQSNIAIEIQQCQQQLQQLYMSPQNIQTQQSINDLQQKLSHLQQQQHYAQNQALFPPQSENAPPTKTTKKKTPSKPKVPKEPKTPKTPRTPKPKKEVKPKEPKPKKETKPKVPKEPKPAKEPKTPKPKKENTSAKKTRKKPITILGPDGQSIEVDTSSGANPSMLLDTSIVVASSTSDIPQINPITGQPIPNMITPVNAKSIVEKKPKVKSATPARRKPAAKVNLNFKKKKKRHGSESDFSEGEQQPLPEGVTKEEDDANKRRSGRIQGSRKKYVDELDLQLSGDDDASKDANPEDSNKAGLVYVDPNSEGMMAVQYILSSRMGQREVISESEDEATEEGLPKKEKGPPRKIEVEEYYVKYKAFSYLHCDWRSEEELLNGDKRIQGKIKRYKQKKLANQNIMDFLEEETFNPDYCEVDRLLDETETIEPQSGKATRHYLVKWKSLPYEDATWEIEDEVDVDKIAAFNLFKAIPAKTELKLKKRPKCEEWKQLNCTPTYKNNNKLRDYQLEGLNWLTFSYYNNHNCILADEMGLGKTIQSLSYVDSIYKYGIRGPFLIIAPLSTIPNWQREFESWTDLNVVVYHGSQISRNMILEYEMYYKDENRQRIPNIFKFNVLITTFEVIISDCVDLKEIQWKSCIIDEAHRLKNKNCKLLEGLRLMTLDHRVLLSGTPLQNNVNELFSLLNFLEPTQFASQEDFLKEFGKLESECQVVKLQALLKPMMLRRMKEDVEKGLAPKEETIVEVELTNIQKKYYRAILERNFDFLCKGATYTNVPSLMNAMMELRKCCLHPYLLNGAEEAIHLDYRDSRNQMPGQDDVYHNALIQSSGKMVLVDKLLPRLKENGHRVLIFSQMVKLLDIIEDYLIYRKYPYERLDGRIRGNLRQAAIDRYCKPDSDRFVFLLCTKAGGLGINLTAADTVIIYDSDWNPQNDLQAQARCHRIGQEKSVKIYRLLCRNTYEREMFDKASLKLGLDKAVLQSMNTDVKGPAAGGNSLGLTKDDIENLLKKGAYGALMDDDSLGDKFCEEDIDSIMSRRTTVITLESEKGSTFSKASFSATNNRSDIDLDDPDFWKKWAKRADIDLEVGDKKKQLVLDEPRRRSQIRRYGHDEAIADCSDMESSGSETGGENDIGDDMMGDLRIRTRRGRGRGRSMRSSRISRSTRWNVEEEVLDGDNVKYGYWARSECFKVEKGLLTFGWGRWKEIMQNGDFRTTWRICDINDCARMILLFCIRYYKGDDKIKGFIFDLIAPTNDGKSRVVHNHIGLSAPVPRGRKGKKKLREAKLIASHMEGADWAKDEKYDTDLSLDQGYSRHLTRHANKVLLRVRLLFYIKQEIIGDLAAQIEDCALASELPIHPPPTELPPKPWWDVETDRNLLVGVYKHGYDRYSVMRNDPTLTFLSKCGPPDKASLMAEMVSIVNEDEMEKMEKDEEKEDSDSNPTPASPAVSLATNKSDEESKSMEREKNYLQYPTASDINGRLRRLVTSYQRNNKKLEMRKEANVRGFDHYLADKLMRRERMAEYIRDRELRKADYNQRRWSNREQAEFYRTISTFGVEYIRKEKRYDWTKFRNLSRLEKRLDENLTEYFRAFMAMCKRQCGIRLSDQENAKIVEVGVDRLPEERARRVLERVDLLNRLRNDILPHPSLQQSLKLALPSKDLPEWWIPGKHDLDLIQGVARHGLGRTDYYILYDPEYYFHEILKRHTAGEPLITKKEKEELHKRFYQEETEDKDSEEIKGDTEKTDIDETTTEENENLHVDGNEGSEDKLKNDSESASEEVKIEKKVDPVVKSEHIPDNSVINGEDLKDRLSIKNEQSIDIIEENSVKKESVKEENLSKDVVKEESPLQKNICEDKPKKEESTGILQQAPLLSLQQMDEAMAKFDPAINMDSLAASEPTVAQLLAQSAANPIKWPKDRVLQTRLEHIMYAVEHNEWPVPINFQSAEVDSSQGNKCDTPPSAPSTPNPQEYIFMESERKKRRHMEEVERVHLQAMLHPNLHHTLGLSKAQHNAAAAVAALGLNLNSLANANLRTLFDAEDKKHMGDSHAHALKQLQALQGTLDLTVKPVSSSQSLDLSSYIPRRGPGRPRLDESAKNSLDKRRHCDSPQDNRPDKKRRKLDEIVLGLSSKTGKDYFEPASSSSNPLSLLKGSSVTLQASKDNGCSMGSTKITSSVSITPTSMAKLHQSDSSKGNATNSPKPYDKEGNSKVGLIKSTDLPPGISLPPGIELYRPSDSTKVDKWLEQHHNLLSESQQQHSLLNEVSKTQKDPKRRKIDFSTFDWNKLSGDEHVSVMNPSTGQKFSGEDAPKLKNLAQWLIDHPSFDVDPQWASESHKDKISSNKADRKDSRSNCNQSWNSKNQFPALDPNMALAGLAGIDPKFLASLDPKFLGALTSGKISTLDPKQLMTHLDPKVLAAMGLDPKLLEAAKLAEQKQSPAPTHSPSSKTPEPKPSTSHSIDPKHLSGFDPHLLQLIDPKLLASLDIGKMNAEQKAMLMAGLDPKLLSYLSNADPRTSTASCDPKMQANVTVDPKIPAGLPIDPKLLAGMGIDHKLLASMGSMDPKILASMGNIDPKLLASMGSIDPKLLASMGSIDPKLLASMGSIDPKLLASMGSIDPKLLANMGSMDPKILATMGIDPVMMMAGFGGLPGMGGLGMPNPLLAGLPAFGLAGLPGMSGSKKDNQRAQAQGAAIAASQANLFSGMLGGAGAAGLMYPHLGLGMGNFALPQMSSALLNGLSPVVTATAPGSSKSSVTTTTSRKSTSDRRNESQRVSDLSKGGLSKEERNMLKLKKAERLAKAGEMWAQESKMARETSSGRSSVGPSEESDPLGDETEKIGENNS